MPLALRVLSALLLAGALCIPAIRWRRVAFVAFVTAGVASFAFRAGWPAAPLTPTRCEGLVGVALAMHSFRNTPHIILFGLCFLLARAQFAPAPLLRASPSNRRAGVSALAVTIVVGALVEVAEGVTGSGHCRLRDLLPDTAGALLGWGTLLVLSAMLARSRSGLPVPRSQ